MSTPKILAFSGSARKTSLNQRLVAIAAERAAQAGAAVKLVTLADYPMPIFNQDEESINGMPKPARAFKELLIEHDGFLIASPEYNSAFSPLLKNALDWASRREPGEERLLAYRGKTAAIMAASPGALGGLRGLVFLRLLLSNLGVTVLPEQHAVAQADKALHPDGYLIDANLNEAVRNLGVRLSEVVGKLHMEDR